MSYEHSSAVSGLRVESTRAVEAQVAGLVGAVKDRFEQVMGPIRGRGRPWAKEKADDRLSDRVRALADVVLSIGARLELIRQAATIRGLGIAGAWSVGGHTQVPMFVVTDGDGQRPVALLLTVLEEGIDGSDKTNADLVARVLVFTFSYEL